MKKVITMVLYNRPEYTRAVLEALRRCDGIGEYLILPHVEPGNEQVLALVEAIDFAEVRMTLNARRLGIGQNTYRAWEHGFRKSDFIIHVEDDTVPARDCLRFMEHCRQTYRDDHEIFSVAAYNREPCDPARWYEISRRQPYTCWLAGIWRDRWEWARTRWSTNPALYATNLTVQVGKYELKEVYPLLSRSQNIGAEGGMQVPSAAWHRANQHTDHWAGNYDVPPAKYTEPAPLVTAVMITGLHRARYPLARVAVECFKQQTYPNKELLIINHGPESLHCGDPRVRELRLVKHPRQTVGDLRNLGLQHAAGDFIISWDDDDWHHPRRIETQMKAREGAAAVFLANRIHHNFENGCSACMNVPDGAWATILHPRRVPFRYLSLTRGSDTAFAQNFEKRIVIDNDPALYIRFFHGLNLWDAGHIMGHLADPKLKNRVELEAKQRKLLKRVLGKYRGWRAPTGTASDRVLT